MYYVVDICRVCLNSDGPLLEITNKDSNEKHTWIKKLTSCVSEVEWNEEDNIFLCKPCSEKLNSAFDFKCLCLESSQTFKKYVKILTRCDDNQLRTLTKLNVSLELDQVSKEFVDEFIKNQQELEAAKANCLQVKVNQDLFSLGTPNVLLNNNQNQFFLSLIPTSKLVVSPATDTSQVSPSKDVNQSNVFLHINNTLLKVLPLNAVSNVDQKADLRNLQTNQNSNVEETKSEELSVEVDPSIFECSENESQSEEEEEEEDDTNRDWEDLISSSKITSDVANSPPPLVKLANKSSKLPEKFTTSKSFVPILPKPTNMNFGNRMDYLNVDHFMAFNKSSEQLIICELCGKVFDTPILYKTHLNECHTDEFPYTCKVCPAAFTQLSDYDTHIELHKNRTNPFEKDTLTLDDLSSQNEKLLFPILSNILHSDAESNKSGMVQYKCSICCQVFTSANGLSQHRRSKHGKPMKRYFIKGMKNGKCDICHREFSTQSYMQLHRKLHFRTDDKRGKVHHKDMYNQNNLDKPESAPIDTSIKEAEPTILEDNCLKVVLEEDPLKMELEEEIAPEEETPLQEVPLEEKSPEPGLKFKINLKNLPQPRDTTEEEREYLNGSDNPDLVLEKVTSDSFYDSPDDSMDCDKSEGILTEERDLLKDEESLDERRPPVNITTINGKSQCSVCLKLFSRRHDLKRHMNNIHLKAIQYICHLCNSHFYEAFHLTRHLRLHIGFVRCTICLKDFSAVRDLKMHVIGAHQNSASVQCGVCGNSYKKIKHLRDHMQEHEKSILYKCHICSENFRESRELTRHLVGHSGIYSCYICQSNFANEHELNVHTKCHSDDMINEKKHECHICHNRYKKKRYLTLHIKNTHTTKIDNECDTS